MNLRYFVRELGRLSGRDVRAAHEPGRGLLVAWACGCGRDQAFAVPHVKRRPRMADLMLGLGEIRRHEAQEGTLIPPAPPW